MSGKWQCGSCRNSLPWAPTKAVPWTILLKSSQSSSQAQHEIPHVRGFTVLVTPVRQCDILSLSSHPKSFQIRERDLKQIWETVHKSTWLVSEEILQLAFTQPLSCWRHPWVLPLQDDIIWLTMLRVHKVFRLKNFVIKVFHNHKPVEIVEII